MSDGATKTMGGGGGGGRGGWRAMSRRLCYSWRRLFEAHNHHLRDIRVQLALACAALLVVQALAAAADAAVRQASRSPVVEAARVWSDKSFLDAPSITRLSDGALLLVFQEMKQSIFKRHPEMRTRYSRDGGATWEGDGVIKGIWWGSVFTCASGVYIIGTERGFSRDNNIVVTRMTDDVGAHWTTPTVITMGVSVHMENTGVDVSDGRVTKAGVPSIHNTKVKPQLDTVSPLSANSRPCNARKCFGLSLKSSE